MAVIEMIPEEGDILLYPDLIRLWVDVQTETVMGMDAGNYLMNHEERDFTEEIISEADARGKLSEKLTVKDSRLCVIPCEDGSERYCRGFWCSTEKQEFLVFLDAETGKEAEILTVKKYGNGQLIGNFS
jgi:germination protein YpeB